MLAAGRAFHPHFSSRKVVHDKIFRGCRSFAFGEKSRGCLGLSSVNQAGVGLFPLVTISRCSRGGHLLCGPHKVSSRLLSTSNKQSGAGDRISKGTSSTFLGRWMAPKDMPPRGTPKWYGEMVLICTVFAITGSSTMVMVRPAVSNVLGLKGSLKDGPWSYRICSLVIMTPLYASLLVVVGTIFGRHAYFRHFSVKMFSRFGIPPELVDKNFHETAKNFRKW